MSILMLLVQFFVSGSFESTSLTRGCEKLILKWSVVLWVTVLVTSVIPNWYCDSAAFKLKCWAWQPSLSKRHCLWLIWYKDAHRVKDAYIGFPYFNTVFNTAGWSGRSIRPIFPRSETRDRALRYIKGPRCCVKYPKLSFNFSFLAFSYLNYLAAYAVFGSLTTEKQLLKFIEAITK